MKLLKKILFKIINTPSRVGNVTVSGFSKGIQNVTFEGKAHVPDRCNFSGNITIGKATTIGYNNFLHGNISIGKYCQLGADVAIHTTNHPVHYLSTYINKQLFDGELSTLKETKKVRIGHDVWIGHNAIIVGNLTIGNGAIIASGSVVTKDVAPYTVVAGVPAKEIKKRFTETVIKEIEALAWWDMSPSELEKNKALFFKNFEDKSSIYA